MQLRNLYILSLLFTIALHATGQTYKRFTTSNGLTSSLINYMYEDRYGIVWIATEDGLNKYDGVKITPYRHRYDDPSSLANNYVSTIIEDSEGNLIVSTYVGLQIYRHSTDDFSPVATMPNGTTMKANISNMILADNGRLYGKGDLSCEIKASKGEKIEVLPMKQQPTAFDNREEELPQELNVRFTLRYDETHLLLGTDDDGIKLYDTQLRTYSDYPINIPDLPQNLQKVHHLMRDKNGNLWIALYQKGVVMLSQRKSMFGYIGSKIAKQDIIGAHCVQSICRSRKGGMWIGTDGDGIYYIANGKAQHITDGIPPIANSLMEDSDGALWIGSFGYPCYRQANGRFEKVDALPEFPRVFCVKEDKHQRIWFGTMGYGLYCYDKASDKFTHIEGSDSHRFINCICITSTGKVLAGTFNGIYDVQEQKTLCHKYIIYAIFEDIKGRIWAGTSEGLIMIDSSKEKVYTTNDGMPSNSVFAITQDDKGMLWFSSNAGLSCFDERSEIFTNYSTNDGIQGTEFSKGAVSKDADGTIWFAGHEGITYFSPHNISQHNYDLHPRITALYINNISVNTKTETGGKPVIDNTLYDCHNFSIAFENNSFSIELATKEIDTPEKCSFLYAIDGEKWITIPDGGHIVSFSNLDAGNHTFCYAVEYNGIRSVTNEVTIEIRHPWWSSPWAKLITALATIAVVILFFFWIRSKEKIKALALISHKIRTPMSLIISPLIQLIDTDKDDDRQKTYKLMLRNAYKLQHLAAQATEEEPIGPIEHENINTDTVNLQQSRTTRQLIIVDDEEEVRHYLCEQLSSDFHVREAANGKEAMQLIFEKAPDAVISDVTMPEMDGITLCRKMKKNIQLAHIPIILLTARADEESTLQGLGIGADSYITKPFNIKILRQKVSNLILLRQQLRNAYQGQQLQEDKLEKIETEDYEDKFMERVMNVINEHISDADFSTDALCKEVGISRAGLHRKLKEKTNQSTSIFVRNIRLKQSEKLLLESNLRINEIAAAVGFKQSSYFINSFRELYGMAPNEWREQKMSQP